MQGRITVKFSQEHQGHKIKQDQAKETKKKKNIKRRDHFIWHCQQDVSFR